MSGRPVAIDARAAAAWPFLRGIVLVVPGTVIQGPQGEMIRIRGDGGADGILPGGHPHCGAAYDPCNTRGAA